MKHIYSKTGSFSRQTQHPIDFSLFVSCRFRIAAAAADVVHCALWPLWSWWLFSVPVKYKEWLYSFSCGGGGTSFCFFFICGKYIASQCLGYAKHLRFVWKNIPAFEIIKTRNACDFIENMPRPLDTEHYDNRKKNCHLAGNDEGSATTKYLCPCFPCFAVVVIVAFNSRWCHKDQHHHTPTRTHTATM